MVRQDPQLGEGEEQQLATVAQIVMPTGAFVTTAIFFGIVVEKLLRDGAVTQDFIDRMREQLAAAQETGL